MQEIRIPTLSSEEEKRYRIKTTAEVSCLAAIHGIELEGEIDKCLVDERENNTLTFAVWWVGGGTVEFELKGGELALVDTYGVDVCFVFGCIRMRTHVPGAPRGKFETAAAVFSG